MMETETCRHWRVELDVNGDPCHVSPRESLNSSEIREYAWSESTKRWTFIIIGDDLTSRVAIEIAQGRRSEIIKQTANAKSFAVDAFVHEGLTVTGFVVGYMLSFLIAPWQAALLACLWMVFALLQLIYRTRRDT